MIKKILLSTFLAVFFESGQSFSLCSVHEVPLTDKKIALTTGNCALSPPTPDFSASSTNSCSAPLTVTFTDLSTGSPTSWAWDVDNDGNTDYTTQSPTHIYTIAGTYTVKLVAANIDGDNTVIKTNYIAIGIPAIPTVGTITQPTCTVATGSVILNGLPATGTWALTKTPGGTVTTGTGVSSTITGLTAGTYTYKVAIAGGCISAASANIVINAPPTTPTVPIVGTKTQPTCALATGSVVLSGLPATGTWTLTSTPGGTAITGTGTSKTITGLVAGTYTYMVTNAAGCISVASANIIINAQPIQTTPTVGTITQPTCSLATGSVILSGLPATGTWTLTKTPGGTTTTGTGTTKTITGLVAGTYTYTVTNSAGCISVASANVLINAQPVSPTVPTVGTITQPTCTLATGSVILNGLPATGTWALTRTPGGITTTGTGTSSTLTGLAAGTYTYKVTNAGGCISVASANVVISAQPVTPAIPTIGTITQPTCILATGSVVLSGLPSGGWKINPDSITGTGTSKTITGLVAGTYTYTVTNAAGCISVASANVVINPQPIQTSPAIGTITQPTCAVALGSVVLIGLPSGSWTINPGSITGTTTSKTITGLAAGTYNYTVTNAAGCISVASDSVVINVQPATPTVPSVGTITQPSCAVATGSVDLSGLPSGNWIINPDSITGTGANTTITGLSAGTYAFTVINEDGCTSAASANVVITALSTSPAAPVVGTISQPTCSVATGNVELSGLPSGSWTINPGNIAGTGASVTLTGLAAGTYNYMVTNTLGCVSAASANVVINPSPIPALNSIANISICEGDTVVASSFSSTPSGATFIWSNSDPTIGLTANGTGNISAFSSVNSTSSPIVATITVTPSLNGCSGISSTYTIAVNTYPAITQNGAVLTSGTSTSYQWYLNGQPIPGATDQSYTTTQNGNFHVVVAGNACPSNVINLNTTGIDDLINLSSLTIFPNPNNGNFTISFKITTEAIYNLELRNALGELVYKERLTDFIGNYSKQMDLTKYGKGLYMISVSNPNMGRIKKIIIY